jgi:hypothetical protein
MEKELIDLYLYDRNLNLILAMLVALRMLDYENEFHEAPPPTCMIPARHFRGYSFWNI